MNSTSPLRKARLKTGLLRYSLLFYFTLAACTPQVTETAEPTPQPLVIAYTPALQPMQAAFHRCVLSESGIALFINEVPAQALDTFHADLSFRLDMSLGTVRFAAPLADEHIDIVLHPSNSLQTLSPEELAGLFSGEINSWSEVGGKEQPVQVRIFPDGNELRQVFDAAVMGDKAVSSTALLASSPANLLEAIVSNPDAIGYLPHAWLTEKVRRLDLDKDLAAALKKPILALATQEPQGAPRRFLSCLQSGEGQEILLQHYEPWNP